MLGTARDRVSRAVRFDWDDSTPAPPIDTLPPPPQPPADTADTSPVPPPDPTPFRLECTASRKRCGEPIAWGQVDSDKPDRSGGPLSVRFGHSSL